MKIETSLITVEEALSQGCTLRKGMNVTLPIRESAEIYGFIATDNDPYSNIIDMPPLGEAVVLSNRVLYASSKGTSIFQLFSEVGRATEEKYDIHALIIPEFVYLQSEWNRSAYIRTLKDEKADPRISRIDPRRIKMGGTKAYYHPRDIDLYFQSASKFRGIATGLAVITRRITRNTEDIKYEVFCANEVLIEKSCL